LFIAVVKLSILGFDTGLIAAVALDMRLSAMGIVESAVVAWDTSVRRGVGGHRVKGVLGITITRSRKGTQVYLFPFAFL
jgi:hypothetical protein